VRKFILFSVFLIINIKIYATHAAGMDIAYECITQGINSDTYKVTIKFYRDCEGIAAPNSHPLDYSSSCGSGTTTLYLVGGAVNINPNCQSYCNGGNGLGIEQYTYEGTITLAHCSNWLLSVCEAARNDVISTIIAPDQQDLCVQATLNNTTYCNNSPTFSQYPTPFICAGNYYCYNNGAIEIDGDSLVYTLITPLNTANGGTVTYIAPYSAINPVGGGSSFDPATGNLCVTPPNIISSVVAIEVSEYRNGILIGSIIRDIQINSFPCTAVAPPLLTGIDTTITVDINNLSTYTVELNCPNGSQNINFDINTINNNPPPPPGHEITINVGGGSWQAEVSWEIYDPSGNGAGTIIAAGGAPFSGTVCIPSTNLGNLEFRMYDSWGDGWNGNTYSLTGNATLTGATTGTLAWGTYGVNTFSVTGGSACTMGGALTTMSWNNGIPGANFTILNNNTMNPTGTFNWTPSAADTVGSPYFFTVDVSNDACPVPGNFSFQYQVILNGANINIVPTITDPSCNNFNDGAISTIITGLNTPYTYNWSSGQSTQNITTLNAGNYTITVTDSLGCISEATYILANPPLFSPIINTTNISCYGANDGFIEVINEPISTTYLWSNSSTTNSIDNLIAGTYWVNILDMNGCLAIDSFFIIEPAEIIVSAVSNNISCYGSNDGNIDLNISGGFADYTVDLPPYSQILLNGVTNFSSQSLLSVGTYIYTITDATGCVTSDSIIITSPAQLTTNTVITNVLCKGEANGTIILNVNGGTAPYYEDYAGNNPLQLSAGDYSYTVTDENGCLISDTFNISEPDSLLSSITTTDVTCAGTFNGTANLYITGGTVPYNTNWNGSNPNGLNAGSHNYIITDNNGCISQGNITINEPSNMELVINTLRVSCYGGSDGSAILNISGGGAPYNISWGILNPDSLPAGNHIITITDSNNCLLLDTVIITQPDEILTNPLITNVSCFGDINGSCNLEISGGTPPYNQDWFGIDSSYLAPGTYSYQIIDSLNCILNGTITIYEPDTLAVAANVIDANCYGGHTGSINLDITGGTAPFEIDFGNFNQYALSAGNYSYQITDANGCTFDSISTVNQPNELFLDFIATSPICRYDESTLSIHISNSLSNIYTISLLDSILKSFVIDTNGILINEGTPIILTPNSSREVYIVSITDDQGCTQIFNDDVHIEVKQLPILAINEDNICVGETSYTLNNATPEGGTYFIDNIMTNFFDVENLENGSYKIKYTYTDLVTSCYNEIEETITINESPSASILFSPQPTNMDNPNILFRDNSNEEEILSSKWHLGDSTIIYNELDFWHTYTDTGTYMIKYYITNMQGCTDSIINFLTINPIYSVFIPDAFTPNNDNINDYFLPEITGEKNYNMKIYNRWGEMIYNDDNSKWDGKINGKLIPNGIYSYSISVFDFNQRLFIYTGIVSLL
tara:strand:- start:70 stop:4356 length:4287 start_codon:yes stop_codon:yes gene_type:complete